MNIELYQLFYEWYINQLVKPPHIDDLLYLDFENKENKIFIKWYTNIPNDKKIDDKLFKNINQNYWIYLAHVQIINS